MPPFDHFPGVDETVSGVDEPGKVFYHPEIDDPQEYCEPSVSASVKYSPEAFRDQIAKLKDVIDDGGYTTEGANTKSSVVREAILNLSALLGTCPGNNIQYTTEIRAVRGVKQSIKRLNDEYVDRIRIIRQKDPEGETVNADNEIQKLVQNAASSLGDYVELLDEIKNPDFKQAVRTFMQEKQNQEAVTTKIRAQENKEKENIGRKYGVDMMQNVRPIKIETEWFYKARNGVEPIYISPTGKTLLLGEGFPDHYEITGDGNGGFHLVNPDDVDKTTQLKKIIDIIDIKDIHILPEKPEIPSDAIPYREYVLNQYFNAQEAALNMSVEDINALNKYGKRKLIHILRGGNIEMSNSSITVGYDTFGDAVEIGKKKYIPAKIGNNNWDVLSLQTGTKILQGFKAGFDHIDLNKPLNGPDTYIGDDKFFSATYQGTALFINIHGKGYPASGQPGHYLHDVHHQKIVYRDRSPEGKGNQANGVNNDVIQALVPPGALDNFPVPRVKPNKPQQEVPEMIGEPKFASPEVIPIPRAKPVIAPSAVPESTSEQTYEESFQNALNKIDATTFPEGHYLKDQTYIESSVLHLLASAKTSNVIMKQGQNNEAFRAFNFAVQLVLEALKPKSFSTINGIFDENMKTCVQEFQKENSLTVDGMVRGDTLGKILKLVTKN